MISMTVPQYRRHECTINGRTVHLQRCETEALAILLVCDPSRFASCETLIEALWPNPDLEPDCAPICLWQRIHRLRAKGVEIENEHGFGWRIPRQAREANPMRMAA